MAYKDANFFPFKSFCNEFETSDSAIRRIWWMWYPIAVSSVCASFAVVSRRKK